MGAVSSTGLTFPELDSVTAENGADWLSQSHMLPLNPGRGVGDRSSPTKPSLKVRCLVPQRESVCWTEAEGMGDKQGERQMLPLSPRQVGMNEALPCFSSSTRGPRSNLQQHFLKFPDILSSSLTYHNRPQHHLNAKLPNLKALPPPFLPFHSILLHKIRELVWPVRWWRGQGRSPCGVGEGELRTLAPSLPYPITSGIPIFPSWKVHPTKRHWVLNPGGCTYRILGTRSLQISLLPCCHIRIYTSLLCVSWRGYFSPAIKVIANNLKITLSSFWPGISGTQSSSVELDKDYVVANNHDRGKIVKNKKQTKANSKQVKKPGQPF